MNKKLINSYLMTWLLFYFLFSSTLQAKEPLNDQEKALYAISSLRLYLEQAQQEPNTSNIPFNETDIASLWLTASSHSSVLNQIEEAQSAYYTALEHHPNQRRFKKFYRKSQISLEKAWEALNPYICHDITIIQRHVNTPPHYPNFDDNPYLDPIMRQRMRNYLLPLSHPLKPALDALFTPARLLENEQLLALTGFLVWPTQPTSQIRIAQHSILPGYLLKFYLDHDTPEKTGRLGCGWERLLKRCEGAKNVRHLIQTKKLIHFSAPNKWLYPPAASQFKLKQPIQPVILLTTDMNIVNLVESVNAWKTQATTQVLDELFCILSHGFASGFLPFNIPYSKNGTFTCIDTEHPKRKVDLKMVVEYLSPEMQVYWQELIRKGGKIN